MLPEKIDQLRTTLGDVNDDLLALLDDLWLEIDHTNADNIKRGSDMMVAVVNAVKAFQNVQDELDKQLRGFLPGPEPDEANEKELSWTADKETITFRQDWSYKRPFGFVLLGKPHPWLRTWVALYGKLCEVLYQRDPKLLESVPERREIISSHGNSYFVRDKAGLRKPMKVAEGIYAETNLSANLIRDNIGRLLRIFNIHEPEMKVYLR